MYTPTTLEYYNELAASTSEEIAARGWFEISQEDYYYFLECVPPRAMKDNAFMCGERVTSCKSGAIYDTFVEVSGRYFGRPAILHEFDPGRYTAEIQKQFGL